MIDLNLLEKDLIRDEGKKLKPYRDSKGILTIGIGHNLDEGIDEETCAYILATDITKHCNDLNRLLPWWQDLDEVRQRALANMCFNLGIVRLLEFRKFLAALQKHDYATAANEMINSLWAQQVGSRANRLEHMIRMGSELQ